MIDFEFTDEQRALRDVARDLFAKQSPPSVIRQRWKGERDEKLWRAVVDVGLLDVIPSGGNEIDLVLVLEEAGRAALPEPFAETLVASRLIQGDGKLGETWLPRIARGEVVATIGLETDPFVAYAAEADLVVLIDASGARLLTRDDVKAKPVRSQDPARPLYSIEAKRGERLSLIAPSSHAAAAIAAVQLGVAQRLLDMSVEYVKERKQFGKPVGSFQAVKHKLATVHTTIEDARPAVWYAAYALANSLPDAAKAASVAKVAASRAEALANAEALQCHGGIGFTWEHDLHIWLKRGLALQPAFGTPAEHRAMLAREEDIDA